MAPIGRLIALAGLVAALSAPAVAQVPEQQGFFGNIDGRWMWLGGDRISSSAGTAPVTNGPGGQMLIGYKLDPRWDVALAGDVQGLLSTLTQFRNGTLSVDTNHQHFDLEAGYSTAWWRVNAGLRGIHYRQGAVYNIPGFAGADQREMYGIGPKVGVGVRLPVSESWAVVGGADAALLYTSFADSGGGVLLSNASYWQFIPQIGGELGMSWRSSDSPSFSFTTGARIASTDLDNGSDYSRALSRRRAEAIREALARDGISPAQVDIVAAGEVPPLAATAPDGREARNTHAQITF